MQSLNRGHFILLLTQKQTCEQQLLKSLSAIHATHWYLFEFQLGHSYNMLCVSAFAMFTTLSGLRAADNTF